MLRVPRLSLIKRHLIPRFKDGIILLLSPDTKDVDNHGKTKEEMIHQSIISYCSTLMEKKI